MEGGLVNTCGGAQNGTSFRDLFLAILPEIQAVSHLVHPHIVRFHGVSSYFPGPGDDDATFHLGFVFERSSETSCPPFCRSPRGLAGMPERLWIRRFMLLCLG